VSRIVRLSENSKLLLTPSPNTQVQLYHLPSIRSYLLRSIERNWRDGRASCYRNSIEYSRLGNRTQVYIASIQKAKWRENALRNLWIQCCTAKAGIELQFPVAPTGIERLNVNNQLQTYFMFSRHSSRQEFLDGIGQTTDSSEV